MREEALRYHAEGQSGKIAVVPTKPSLRSTTFRWPTRPAWRSRASKS